MEYAELQVTSNFSFLRGASHPEELITRAKKLGLSAIALTDLNSLAGIVRAYSAAEEQNIPFLTGCRVELLCEDMFPADRSTKNHPEDTDGYFTFSLLVFPTSLAAYQNLSRLLSKGNFRAEKGSCLLSLNDFFDHQQELAAIAVPPVFSHGFRFSNRALLNFQQACTALLEEIADTKNLSIALTHNYEHNNSRHIHEVKQIAHSLGLPLVATNDVYYHSPERKMLQDVLSCIRLKTTLEKAGYLLFPNSERCIKPPAEMYRLFRENPAALKRTLEIAEMAQGFSLRQLRYEYPAEVCSRKKTPLEYLTELTWQGARERYPENIPQKVKKQIAAELKVIHELNYEKYFLTCYDIVQFARSKKILCQGRGAAANSAVCFCLGITSVDPDRIDLLFARFVSKERDEPPDIDIDFEHERREEVIQYIYQKYGRERAALTCEVVTYRARSAIREVAKTLGLSLEVIDLLAKSLHRWTGCTLSRADLQEVGLHPDDPAIWNTLLLCQMLQGFPRHLSQHVGGFIISEEPLCEIVPILNASMEARTIIEWDKDDIEVLGMLKIDVLGLGMLTCIRKALELINTHYPINRNFPLELHTIPAEDPQVYDMICASDTIGVFQIESRAQMSMLPRLRPRRFYDLVVEVAIVRPGPIHGDMVHPYLRRRNGVEKVHYPDEEVKLILGKTLGVPIFQEQAMRLAIVLAGFSPGEAEQLRRAMSAWRKNKRMIEEFQERIVTGMTSRGYSERFAESCVNQLKGFSEYGFPESHAASFALLVYVSAWIKCHYPAVFAAALLNSQPMGFYAPSQIIADAKSHGVTLRPVDANLSEWDSTIEDAQRNILRVGMRLIKGIRKNQARLLAQQAKTSGPFRSITDLWNAAHNTELLPDRPLRKTTLITLARADAFSSMNLSRRQALWEIRGLPEAAAPLDQYSQRSTPSPHLRPLNAQMNMFQDYESSGFSLKGHPLATIRPYLINRTVSTAAALAEKKQLLSHRAGRGIFASAAGLSIIRQRPGTSKGVVFITLEDETGMINLIIRPGVFERYQKVILLSTSLLASGFLQSIAENDTSNLVYILVTRLERLDEKVLAVATGDVPVKSYSY